MSRKNYFLLFFAVSLSFVTYKLITTLRIKNTAENISKNVPPFSFQTLKNTPFKNSDIADINSKIIINYFNPSCEHCQYMATQYYLQREKIKKIQFLLITNADSISTNVFYRKYRLDSLPNVVLLLDSNSQFYKLFGSALVPSFFIYNQQKLVAKIIGETNIENLLK